MCTALLADLSVADRFSVEVLSRLKAKVISRAFHPVYLFLVGLVRHDRVRLARLFDVTLRESGTASLPREGATSEDSSLHEGVCYAVHDGPVPPRALGPSWGKAART